MNEIMYARLSRLYKKKKLTAAGLANAVIAGWITADQKKEITASK